MVLAIDALVRTLRRYADSGAENLGVPRRRVFAWLDDVDSQGLSVSQDRPSQPVREGLLPHASVI